MGVQEPHKGEGGGVACLSAALIMIIISIVHASQSIQQKARLSSNEGMKDKSRSRNCLRKQREEGKTQCQK